MALTLLHADTGTRSDRELDGDTMSDGVGAWSGEGAGNWSIVSNKIKGNGAADVQTAYDSVMSVATTDQKSEAKIHTGDSGVTCRRNTASAYYLAYIATVGGGATLYYYDGSFHSIGSGGTFASAGDTMAIEAVGTAIKVYINASQVISVTDSMYSAGHCGLYGGGGGGSLFTDFADYTDAGGGGVSIPVFRHHYVQQGAA